MNDSGIEGAPDVSTHRLVTLLTDFGLEGGYVAACEAVIASVEPRARILHLSHQVAVGDIRGGALILRRSTPLCPIAVHVAVVDPGVGTARRPLALQTSRGDIFVGPDNGLLVPGADALGGLETAWVLDPSLVRQTAGLSATGYSSTFHGRDLFAPAAGLLSRGVLPGTLGKQVEADSLARLPDPAWARTEDGLTAEVTEVDRFGNVELAASFDQLEVAGPSVVVEVEGEDLLPWEARIVDTFGQLEAGELGVFRDSWGCLALALNGASAAQLLTVERGMTVRLTAGPRAGTLP